MTIIPSVLLRTTKLSLLYRWAEHCTDELERIAQIPAYDLTDEDYRNQSRADLNLSNINYVARYRRSTYKRIVNKVTNFLFGKNFETICYLIMIAFVIVQLWRK